MKYTLGRFILYLIVSNYILFFLVEISSSLYSLYITVDKAVITIAGPRKFCIFQMLGDNILNVVDLAEIYSIFRKIHRAQ